MTQPMDSSPAADAPLPPLPRGPIGGPGLAAIVLVLVAVACVLAGAAAERYSMLRRLGPMGSLMFHDGPSPEARTRMRDRMRRDLNLTPEQEVRIDTIMAHRTEQSQRLRIQIDSQMRALIFETRGQIDSVLTPDQQRKFHEGIRRRALRDSAAAAAMPQGPPPGDGPGGPDGPPPGPHGPPPPPQ